MAMMAMMMTMMMMTTTMTMTMTTMTMTTMTMMMIRTSGGVVVVHAMMIRKSGELENERERQLCNSVLDESYPFSSLISLE